ncbi:MAG: HDIG domain-containing protein [Dehalococcoidia bacterium]
MMDLPPRERAAPPIPPAGIASFTGLLAGLLLVVLFPFLPVRLKVEAGQIASHTVRAPRDLRYNSEILRAQLQTQRKASVDNVYTYDVNVRNQQRARLTEITSRITVQRDTPGLTRPARDEGIARIQGVKLSAAQRAALLDLTPDQWARTIDEADRVLGVVLEEPFFSDSDTESRRAAVRNRVHDGIPVVQGDLAVALVQPLVVPTQRVDEVETQKARERAEAGVEPQAQTYAKNQVILREGDEIDAAKLEALRQAGLLDFHLSINEVAAVLVVSILVSGALGLYLHVFQPPSMAGVRRLIATALLVAGLALIAKLYLPLVLPDTLRRYLAFALPIAAAPMLIAVLFEAPFAVIVAVACAALSSFTAMYLPDVSGIVGLNALQPLQLTTAYLFGGLAGVLTVHRAERLNRFILAGVAVSAASFLSLLSFWFLDGSRRPLDLAWMGGVSALGGGLSAVLAVGLFALLGSVFGVTTRLQLMELAQLNAPLLRRLQDEAPGTFHHSIIVGNLAERAADLIGADSLLVRVGCYYHDIGKMGRPAFFIENQLSGQNPHDGLPPQTSSQILQDHVQHGLELGRRHRLPEKVRNLIQQHHGTLRTAYFYRMAAATRPSVDPTEFTYEGPRPQSRRPPCSCADSAEASVRASSDRSQERIDTIRRTRDRRAAGRGGAS